MKQFIISITLATLVLASFSLRAADKVNPAEQKMREAMRNAMIQLRDANAKLATVQAAEVEDQEKIKDLQAQLESLIKKSSSEKKTADETIDELRNKLAASDMQNTHLTESLSKWKMGYAKMAE